MVLAAEIGAALLRDHFAIDPCVANHHLQPFLECAADDFALMQIRLFAEGNAVRQRPRVALARDGAELVSGGEALLV